MSTLLADHASSSSHSFFQRMAYARRSRGLPMCASPWTRQDPAEEVVVALAGVGVAPVELRPAVGGAQ